MLEIKDGIRTRISQRWSLGALPLSYSPINGGRGNQYLPVHRGGERGSRTPKDFDISTVFETAAVTHLLAPPKKCSTALVVRAAGIEPTLSLGKNQMQGQRLLRPLKKTDPQRLGTAPHVILAGSTQPPTNGCLAAGSVSSGTSQDRTGYTLVFNQVLYQLS